MCTRIIRLTALLGCLMLGSPTLAQTDQQRVPLIMSKLPSQRSATYKGLKALADNPAVQALALTKSEIWSVPAEKVDAVMQAAARHGVDVRPLGERTADAGMKRRRTRGAIPEASREPRDDWSQIFRLAPADTHHVGGWRPGISSSTRSNTRSRHAGCFSPAIAQNVQGVIVSNCGGVATPSGDTLVGRREDL